MSSYFYMQELSRVFHYLEEKSFSSPIFKTMAAKGKRKFRLRVAVHKLEPDFVKVIIFPYLKDLGPKLVRMNMSQQHKDYKTVFEFQVSKLTYRQLKWLGVDNRVWYSSKEIHKVCAGE